MLKPLTIPAWSWLLILFALLAAAFFLTRATTIPQDQTQRDLALLHAVKHDHLAKFKALLGVGANPNAHIPDRHGVMCEATEPGREEFLRTAIAHGGNVSLYTHVSSIFATPLNCAISNGNPKAFHILVEHGADLSQPGCPECGPKVKAWPLQTAANLGEFDMALDLLQRLEKQGPLPQDQVDAVIDAIERGYLGEGSPADLQRQRVIAWLRSKGYHIGPAASYHRGPGDSGYQSEKQP